MYHRVGTSTLALVPLLLLAACHGGSQVGAGTEAPFGLETRESLAALTLPSRVGEPATYRVANAFPNLPAFQAPLFLAGVPGENRIVVVEQPGRIQAFDNDPDVASSTVVLDIADRVVYSGEQGLLGLAFDPRFQQNRYIYVNYIATSATSMSGARSIIARYTWSGVAIDKASEKILLVLDQPYANHNAGMLAFSPIDGFLYIAFGDGGSGGDPNNNAQNLGVLPGKLLRVDVHPQDPNKPYDIPPDNPFVNTAGARGEIWAYGLRNPFRFSFDRRTGDLWLGDVGQNRFEEVDLIEKGGNYGWRVFEGNADYDASANTLPDSAFTPPIVDYGRDQGVTVIGGYVYRGTRLASLAGQYLYGDVSSGNVWALDYDGMRLAANVKIIEGPNLGLYSFGEDNNAEVYLVLAGGTVNRLEEASPGPTPAVPALLSETGIFTHMDTLAPAAGLVEYDVNVPFWSDGAIKRRWIGLPDGAAIELSATGNWSFPVGTLLVKHFEIDMVEGDPATRRRLETRLLTRTVAGWRGFTYRWNTAGTDADLLAGRETEPLVVTTPQGDRTQTWEYPGGADCLRCHTDAAGNVLGIRTRQLNKDFDYADSVVTDNQLRAWNHIGLFATDIGSALQYDRYPAPGSGMDLDARARAYLATNCAQCHQPGGGAPTSMDLRFDTALADTGAVGAAPQAGDLGIAGARIIAPGDKSTSLLWERLRRLDAGRMPPLGSHRIDDDGVALIGEWIDGM